MHAYTACACMHTHKRQKQREDVSTYVFSNLLAHSEFIPRDTEKSEFPDLVDFGGVAISMETFIVLLSQ